MKNKESLLDKIKLRAHALKIQSHVLYLAYKHPGTPWYAKVFAGLVAAYAFSPIDLIPDFIPILGYFDDLVLVPLGVTLALKMIPEEVIEESRSQAEERIAEGNPVSMGAAVVIVAVWVFIIAIFIHWIFNLQYQVSLTANFIMIPPSTAAM